MGPFVLNVLSVFACYVFFNTLLANDNLAHIIFMHTIKSCIQCVHHDTTLLLVCLWIASVVQRIVFSFVSRRLWVVVVYRYRDKLEHPLGVLTGCHPQYCFSHNRDYLHPHYDPEKSGTCWILVKFGGFWPKCRLSKGSFKSSEKGQLCVFWPFWALIRMLGKFPLWRTTGAHPDCKIEKTYFFQKSGKCVISVKFGGFLTKMSAQWG